MGSANGAGIANASGTFTLKNTILSTNLSVLSGTNFSFNAYGTVTDAGHNLSSDSTPAGLGSSSAANTDPELAPLAANGGPTLTMALAAGSPALYMAGNNPANFPPTDQRGVPRPNSSKGADIGAYELAASPAIVTQPQSQTQPYGGSATFTVTALGYSPLYYQWLFIGTNLYGGSSVVVAPSTNFAFSTATNLTIQPVTITNAGSYSVVVSNSYGSVTSAVAILSVPPYIVIQPTNQEVGVSQDVPFVVMAAADQPLTYQWFLNVTNPIPSATNASYEVHNVQATNDGSTYSVIFANSLGSVTSAVATLTVDAAPFITMQPTGQEAEIGSSVTFNVAASGTQPLSYQWYLNGSPRLGFISPTLPFTVQTTDAGYWDVVVSNRFGVVTSTPPAVLLVPPLALAQPQVASSVFRLSFQTVAGVSYVLQYKNALTDSNWIPLLTNSGTGNLLTNTDPATNLPSRFYRVRAQ
jgi:hypothetical protein